MRLFTLLDRGLLYISLGLGLSLVSPVLAKPPEAFQNDLPSQWAALTQPRALSASVQATEAFPDQAWWRAFQDPYLNATLEAVLKNNLSFQQAAARVDEAKALTRAQIGGLFPTLSFAPTFNRQKNSANLTVPSAQQFSAAGPRLFAPGQTVNIYTAPLQARYEPDFWLKHWDQVRLQKLGRADAQAQLQRLALSLVSEAATAYFNLIQADSLIESQIAIVQLDEEAVALSKSRYTAGLDALDVTQQAEAALAQSQAQLVAYSLTRDTALYQLAVLMGKTPAETLNWPRSGLSTYARLEQSLPVGVPSLLVAHRPDVAAAEAQLAQARININLARKAYLPDFTLTGQFGYASTQLKRLVSTDSILTSVGAGMTQWLFNGGTRRANLKASKARYKQALAGYRQTVLNAFEDVETSLASVQAHTQQHAQARHRQALLQEKLGLAESRYQAGLSAALPALTAKNDQLLAEQAVVKIQAQLLVDRVTLYKALDGGY